MKQTSGKLFTKIVCMILCIFMLLPTFASCTGQTEDPSQSEDSEGLSSETTQKEEDNKTDSGAVTDPTGEDTEETTPGGDTETTYYKVNFAVAIEEYKNRVTLPKEKLYEAGTEIQYLPTPVVKDMLFMGWYYDATMTKPVEVTDKVNSDLMLYAKVVDTSNDISVIEGVYYHTVYDADSDYTFLVKAESLSSAENSLTIENISSAGKLLELGSDYTVTDEGDGMYRVSAQYKPDLLE